MQADLSKLLREMLRSVTSVVGVRTALSEYAGVVTSVRHASSKRKMVIRTNIIPKMQTPTWSTGEVSHPGPKDTPLGNKGVYPYDLPDGGKQYFGFQYYPRLVVASHYHNRACRDLDNKDVLFFDGSYVNVNAYPNFERNMH